MSILAIRQQSGYAVRAFRRKAVRGTANGPVTNRFGATGPALRGDAEPGAAAIPGGVTPRLPHRCGVSRSAGTAPPARSRSARTPFLARRATAPRAHGNRILHQKDAQLHEPRERVTQASWGAARREHGAWSVERGASTWAWSMRSSRLHPHALPAWSAGAEPWVLGPWSLATARATQLCWERSAGGGATALKQNPASAKQ